MAPPFFKNVWWAAPESNRDHTSYELVALAFEIAAHQSRLNVPAVRSCAQTNGRFGDCTPEVEYQQPLKPSQRYCLAWRISVRPKHYEQVRIQPIRPLVSLSRQAGRDVPKWTCAVSTKILSARSLPFWSKHANDFYCAVGTSVTSPRWVSTTIFCWFRHPTHQAQGI